jgi:hypothetical protein
MDPYSKQNFLNQDEVHIIYCLPEERTESILDSSLFLIFIEPLIKNEGLLPGIKFTQESI